jgi:hypothetical protein
LAFIARSIDSTDEYSQIAYFLDVDEAGDIDRYGRVWTDGKNNKGGKFTLKIYPWEDVGDGTIVNEKTTGTISYNHGPLKGEDEPVDCTKN